MFLGTNVDGAITTAKLIEPYELSACSIEITGTLECIKGYCINESHNMHWVSDDAQLMENKRVALDNRSKMWEEYKKDLQERLKARRERLTVTRKDKKH